MKFFRSFIICVITLVLLSPVFAQAPQKAKIAFVANDGNGWGIDIMNPDGSERINLIKHPDSINQLAWSPSGEQILFCARNSEGIHDIYIVKADGTKKERLFKMQNYKRQPTWAPDGDKIAYMAYSKIWQSWGVHVAAIDGNFVSPLIRVGQHGGDPAWSPDGEKVAFYQSSPQDPML